MFDDNEEVTAKIRYKEYFEEGPLSVDALLSMSEAELHAVTANAAEELAQTLSRLESLKQTVEHARGVMRQAKETLRIRTVR